ncbi:MAG TPA: nickel-responsive transcriptional regulator NikR [Candidatus Ozemobacteraceae bacterium]|nr:nickel-responsive transcriptional regulator NikR [Candidatus Ozemobacteraceae bacterium]
MSNTADTQLRRFSVCMPAELVTEVDNLVATHCFANRSHALSELVRSHLTDRHGTEANSEVAATITLVYDHHKRDLQALLTDIQHDHQSLIIASMHVHLDHHRCLEILTVRGNARLLRELSDRLLAVRGVSHGRMTVNALLSRKPPQQRTQRHRS